MLNTEQKIHRLEDIMARVRRNRSALGPIDSSINRAVEPVQAARPVQAVPDLPAPSEPPPVRRISRVPESTAPTPSVDSPVEPEPMLAAPIAPEPVFRAPKPEPSPEPKSEPAPKAALAAPEPEPDFILATHEHEPVTIIPAAPEPVVLAPKPVPEPVQIAATPTETRTFESAVHASASVFSIQGERPREWTLHAVLDRAWRVGQSDKNES